MCAHCVGRVSSGVRVWDTASVSQLAVLQRQSVRWIGGAVSLPFYSYIQTITQ